MAAPQDPAELALVILAVTCGLTGCCEWDDKAASRFRSQPVAGLTPKAVARKLREYVRAGGPLQQVRETRPEYSDRRFYYKAVLPVPGILRHGLFVEIVLDDDDPDVPAVLIVNCHEQLG